MRALTIADSAAMILGLQDEIRRSEESRYDHRLHGVLLVAQGMTCPEVARLLGDAPRSVEYWVRGFEAKGLAGLQEGERAGRPRRLDEKQLREINSALRRMPRDMGLGGTLWDGKTLADWIAERYEIDLGVRQWQRLFRQLGFRRGALPATRLPMPDVDSARNQGPGLAACSHAAQRRIFWRGAIARWEVYVLPRNRQVQWRELFRIHEEPAPQQHPNRSPGGGDHRQRQIPSCPSPPAMARRTYPRLFSGLSAALLAGPQPYRTSLEAYTASLPAQSLLQPTGSGDRFSRSLVPPMDESQRNTA